MAGGLEQGSWGLGRVSKGLGGWGLERAEGLGGWGLERAEGLGSGGGGGLDPLGTSGRTFARTFARSDRRTENSPLCPIGHRPLRVRCPKAIKETVEQGKGTGDHLMPLGDWL